MKLPKSSHTGDPLAAVLILYPGKVTRPPKTLGNLSRTYNMLKQYSRSTSNGGISTKTELRGANLWVLKLPPSTLSRLRGANRCVFKLLFLY